jgi:hypothetical protein
LNYVIADLMRTLEYDINPSIKSKFIHIKIDIIVLMRIILNFTLIKLNIIKNSVNLV